LNKQSVIFSKKTTVTSDCEYSSVTLLVSE